MAMQLEPATLQRLPEEYIIEEDLAEMGDTNPHTHTGDNVEQVLSWRYQKEGWVLVKNMNVYHPAIINSRHYIVPDVTLIKIALPSSDRQNLTSWDAMRQAPAVVFEVCSDHTWPHDVEDGPNDKPAIYGRIGVKEYFAYDPQHPSVWKGMFSGRRLRGWRYNKAGQPIELVMDSQGRLRSEELDCYLVEDDYYLAFVDENGQRYLTESQAEKLGREQAELRAQAEEAAREQAEAALQAETRAREAETVARQQAEVALQAETRARQAEEAARQALELQIAELMKKLEGKE